MFYWQQAKDQHSPCETHVNMALLVKPAKIQNPKLHKAIKTW